MDAVDDNDDNVVDGYHVDGILRPLFSPDLLKKLLNNNLRTKLQFFFHEHIFEVVRCLLPSVL